MNSLAIKQELDAARAKLLVTRPPHLPPLEAVIGKLTTAALLDAERIPELREAQNKLDEAHAEHKRKAELETTIADLERQLQQAEHAERLALIEEIKADYASLLSDYEQASVALADSYRAVLTAQRRAGQRNVALALPPGFDARALVPMGWQGTASDIMAAPGGALPYEIHRKEQTA